MFTGIVEATAEVVAVAQEQANRHFTLKSPISGELKVDQSVCHDGVCLTVVALGEGTHTVTAVSETLRRSNLDHWQPGTLVNLERSLKIGDRLDGHMVQGHVDAVTECLAAIETGGSWRFDFRIPEGGAPLMVDKGSVCLNGVSLTVVTPGADVFSVAVIPYTWTHTNFRLLHAGAVVNVEYDVVGKYFLRWREVAGR